MSSTTSHDTGHRTRLLSKRKASPVSVTSSAASTEEPATKKAKPASTSYPPEPPADLALRLSTLVWAGSPYVWSVDGGEPERFGEYTDTTPIGAGELDTPVWSAERGCFVFTPQPLYQFFYARENFISQGRFGDEYCSIFGDADDVLPITFLHRTTNTTPWVARTSDEKGETRVVDTPPFEFWTGSIEGDADIPVYCFREGSSPHIALSEPDLELHQKAEETGEGAESDDDPDEEPPDWEACAQCKGWSGNWTRELIRQDQARIPLGSLEKEVWQDGDRKMTWGMKVRLVPVPRSVEFEYWYKDDPDSGKRVRLKKAKLLKYIVQASVLEVYVNSEFLATEEF